MIILKKNKKRTPLSLVNKNYFICVFIVICAFFLDRLSKVKIIENQLNNNSIYINDFINFDSTWNNGIGFGLFSSSSSLYYNLMTMFIACVIIFIVYLIIKSNLIDKILFSIVLGGAIGNFYDRLIYFAVPDFIDIHYERFHWFTFNIADILISMGIILLILNDMFFKNDKI